MTERVSDRSDSSPLPAQTALAGLAAPVNVTDDPARYVGEIFRRLASSRETFGETGFGRVAAAVLVALGRAVLEEAERQAQHLKERSAPAPAGMRVSATARRVDFDGWDPGDAD